MLTLILTFGAVFLAYVLGRLHGTRATLHLLLARIESLNLHTSTHEPLTHKYLFNKLYEEIKNKRS